MATRFSIFLAPRAALAGASLALALGACGGPAIAPGGGPEDGGPPPDAAPLDPIASCELEQHPAFDALLPVAAIATVRGVYVATHEGLWHAATVDDRFERVATIPFRNGPGSLAALDDGSLFAWFDPRWDGEGGSVFESADGGATWIERPFDVDLERFGDAIVLDADGTRLVARNHGIAVEAGVIPLVELDRDTGRWVPIPGAPPADRSPFWIGRILGFDRGAIVAAERRDGGIYRLAVGGERWEHIPGLDEWGYSSYAARGELGVSTSLRGIFARVDGAWTFVEHFDYQFLQVAAGDDGFVAVAATRARRSVDGTVWEETTAPGFEEGAPFSLSRSGDALVALHAYPSSTSAAAIRLSGDAASSWRDPDLVAERVGHVVLHDAALYANRWRPGTYDWRVRDGDGWSPVRWSEEISYGTVAFTDDGAWECSSDGCAYRSDAGDVGERTALPPDHAATPEGAFATSHGVFVASRAYLDETCGVPLHPGLARLDPATGTWSDASRGLPYEPIASGPCAGRPVYIEVVAMIEHGEVLIATTGERWRPSPQPSAIHRSTDGGATWEAVLEGDELIAIETTDHGTFALLAQGGLVVTDARLSALAPVASSPPGTVTDLVALDGRLVASTESWSGPSIWVSGDGARTWEPLEVEGADRIGPAGDLDVRGSRLAIASLTSSAWIATGCF